MITTLKIDQITPSLPSDGGEGRGEEVSPPLRPKRRLFPVQNSGGVIPQRRRWVCSVVLNLSLLLLLGTTWVQGQVPTTNVVARAPEPGTRPAMGQTNGYVIVPNDLIWIKVYQEEDLEVKTKVGKDGKVTLPLLGAVTVGGKTVEDASTMVRELLDKRFIVNPQVTLSVVEYSKRKFTVLGQVQRPGIYEYSGDETMTLLQAIALAGGYTTRAATSKVTVQRVEDGLLRTYKAGAEAGLKDAKRAPFEIRNDDTISVGARMF